MKKFLIKSKKQMFLVISIFTLILFVGGVSIAFFNYTRTGGANTVSVGRISFTSSQETITFENVFPIDSTQAGSDTTNAKIMSVTVTGDTDYTNGLEYVITVSDVNLSVNNKQLPVALEVSVANNSNLGTAETGDYYTNRDNYTASKYKVEYNGNLKNGSHILVGYIAPNATAGTPSGIEGTINIKAYIDKDRILISDTYPEGNVTINNQNYYNGTTNPNDKVVFTTSEWNAITGANALSFKIKVEANEGVWVEKYLSPDALIRKIKENIDTTTLINFGNNSSASNGQGVYILPGTESDTNPIYYYRGAVTDNNVIFGGYCWQMVRTTDTGGIKMIYNGIPDVTGSGSNISYNCGITRDIQDDIMTTESLSSSTGYYYADDYEIVSSSGNGATYKLKSKVNQITQVPIANAADASTNIPTIVANYPYTCKRITDTATCTILYKVDSYTSETNANVYASTAISIIGQSAFNSNHNSMSDVGYMSNKRYDRQGESATSGAYFGSGISYANGVYTLTGTSTTQDASHHYTCNNTIASATCSPIRYYYYNSNYINLEGGEDIEDAIYKMTGNGTTAVKARTINQNYNLNQNDSAAKTAIETWFRTNLTNEVDSTKTDYRPYIEDTVYCNDRSFQQTGDRTLAQSGWNPNADGTSGNGGLTTYIKFNTGTRLYNYNWYSTTNVPTVVCPNEIDRFTESSTIAHLNYPVGLLTGDEIVMAGAAGNSSTNDKTYYLYTGGTYWSLSPSSHDYDAYGTVVYYNAYLSGDNVHTPLGLRPVISLKPGIEFEEGGLGTALNPYVVKYD